MPQLYGGLVVFSLSILGIQWHFLEPWQLERWVPRQTRRRAASPLPRRRAPAV